MLPPMNERDPLKRGDVEAEQHFTQPPPRYSEASLVKKMEEIDPKSVFAKVRHAGAAFLGRFCPEAVGDYVGGPNHVLPTSRTARFASGLSVYDFLKRTTYIAADREALEKIDRAAQHAVDRGFLEKGRRQSHLFVRRP